MKKPHGRKIKKKVGELLLKHHRETSMQELEKIPDDQLVGPLFSYFYHKDETIKFRSVTAMGILVSKMGKTNMEKARIVLRRIMWNLNDESGGIGWGSPEAMGEILSQSPKLALEFKSILFSYLDQEGNYLEHEMLQRGVLWGIGTYLKVFPGDLTETTKSFLLNHLKSDDPVKKGYALRALINAQSFDFRSAPENIIGDTRSVDIFTGWHFSCTRISDMALDWEETTMLKKKCDLNIARTIVLAQQMIKLAQTGYEQREDPSCGVLYGILLDSGYRVLALAKKEKQSHLKKGNH